jgi:hypothetical protein
VQAFDAQILQRRLNELAEVFDKKPVGEKALTVWFGVLKEFPTEKVCSVLIGWPKTHGKFPTPAEVWKASNEVSISAREDTAKRMIDEPPCAPEVAKRFMAEVRKFLAKPSVSARDHWKRVLETQPKDSIGYRYAVEALKAKGVIVPQREPGQDDEEKRAVNF